MVDTTSEDNLAVLRGIHKVRTLKYFIRGIVSSGRSEGQYFVNLEEYKQQFREKLGFEPYLGTLNLRIIDRKSIKSKNNLSRIPSVVIQGFTRDGKTYGAVKCFKALINKTERCVVLIIERTHYEDVIEVLAPVKLREKLDLKDGDLVELEVFY